MILKIICFPFVLWVIGTMIKEIKFNKYFFIQRLKCVKCLTFWISLTVLYLVFKDFFVSLSVASVLSYIANRMSINKDGSIKL